MTASGLSHVMPHVATHCLPSQKLPLYGNMNANAEALVAGPTMSGSGTITDSVGTALFGYGDVLSGYERIAYLQASGTGNNGQYIDTGDIHDNSTRLTCGSSLTV